MLGLPRIGCETTHGAGRNAVEVAIGVERNIHPLDDADYVSTTDYLLSTDFNTSSCDLFHHHLFLYPQPFLTITRFLVHQHLH